MNETMITLSSSTRRKAMGRPPRFSPEQVAAALTASGGLIAPAARALACTRETLLDYARRHPAVATARAAAREDGKPRATERRGRSISAPRRPTSPPAPPPPPPPASPPRVLPYTAENRRALWGAARVYGWPRLVVAAADLTIEAGEDAWWRVVSAADDPAINASCRALLAWSKVQRPGA